MNYIDDRGARSRSLRHTVSHAITQHKKATHEEADYQQAPLHSEDRCITCQSYNSRDNCKKVVAPISPNGRCKLGTSIKDSHKFSSKDDGRD